MSNECWHGLWSLFIADSHISHFKTVVMFNFQNIAVALIKLNWHETGPISGRSLRRTYQEVKGTPVGKADQDPHGMVVTGHCCLRCHMCTPWAHNYNWWPVAGTDWWAVSRPGHKEARPAPSQERICYALTTEAEAGSRECYHPSRPIFTRNWCQCEDATTCW